LNAKLNLWICTACKGIIKWYGRSIRVGREVGMEGVFVVVL